MIDAQPAQAGGAAAAAREVELPGTLGLGLTLTLDP